MLRLFNDPVAMLFLYTAIWLFINQKWWFGSIFYRYLKWCTASCNHHFFSSLAVSIKMNILLFSPGVLVMLLLFLGWQGTLVQLLVCALVQFVVGAPFLWSNPVAYLDGAFNFGRVFLYQWTVNWRLLPEWVFLHKGFHLMLLLIHLVVVVAFALKHWAR